MTVAEVLEHTSQRIENDFPNQPEIAVDVLSTIGSTYAGLGMYNKAKATIQTALHFQERTHGTEHPEAS
jgi:adenine-specific DNA glycosylase